MLQFFTKNYQYIVDVLVRGLNRQGWMPAAKVAHLTSIL